MRKADTFQVPVDTISMSPATFKVSIVKIAVFLAGIGTLSCSFIRLRHTNQLTGTVHEILVPGTLIGISVGQSHLFRFQ